MRTTVGIIALSLLAAVSLFGQQRDVERPRRDFEGLRGGYDIPARGGTFSGQAQPQRHTPQPGSSQSAPAGSGYSAGRTGYSYGFGAYDCYYPSLGWTFNPNRCLILYSLLWQRWGIMRPDLFPKVKREEELYLRKEALDLALNDALDEVKRLEDALAALSQRVKASEPALAGGSDKQKREEIKKLVERIRWHAQQIQEDQIIDLLDVRRDQDLLRDVRLDRMSLSDKLQRLEELTASLRSALEGLRGGKSAAVVSVSALEGPSVRALARGIEKVAGRIKV